MGQLVALHVLNENIVQFFSLTLNTLIEVKSTQLYVYDNTFNTFMIDSWSKESKGFSISIVTNRPSLLLRRHLFAISGFSVTASPLNLFLIYAVGLSLWNA